MKYSESIILKNGQELLLRNGTVLDSAALLENFNTAHAQTDFLLTYPDENSFTVADEEKYLRTKEESSNEIEILAFVEGKLVGSAGIEAVGTQCKLKHRAEFGISILKEFWGMGIGKALTAACLKCAKEAGYSQTELNVVAENIRAIALYEKMGFVEYGRNPRGFKSRNDGYQEVVYMYKITE